MVYEVTGRAGPERAAGGWSPPRSAKPRCSPAPTTAHGPRVSWAACAHAATGSLAGAGPVARRVAAAAVPTLEAARDLDTHLDLARATHSG